MKLIILDGYCAVSTDLSLDCMKPFCSEMIVYDRTPKKLTIERIGDAEMIITNKTIIDKNVIDNCPNLKYIGLFATGYNIIDVDYARQKSIVVSNAPAYSTMGVAQLTFALIMSFYNKVSDHNQRVKKGEWEKSIDFCFYDASIMELYNKTIGLVGFGSIAKQVAKIATAFGMNVLVNSRTVYKDYESDNLKFVSLDELLQKSDIVSLHCPLFEETKHLINSTTLAKMKKTAIIINTARGPILDEQAVADALNNGVIAGLGVDVVSVEPILTTNPLLKAKNCIITPHTAWAGVETRSRLVGIVMQNLKAFVEGNPTNNVAK